MITLGFDTATPATAVGLRLGDGAVIQARDDPAAGERPGHTTRLLALADALLGQAEVGWEMVDRIAVGLGPGTFTGLRIGLATARGLAQSLSAEIVGVSSLRALAHAAGEPAVLSVIDARRGEVFVAAYVADGSGSIDELLGARALAPEQILGMVAEARVRSGGQQPWTAFGDGAVRYRGDLEAAGVTVAPEASPLHRVNAGAICELGVSGAAAGGGEEILPDYVRRPDAEISLSRTDESGQALEGARP